MGDADTGLGAVRLENGMERLVGPQARAGSGHLFASQDIDGNGAMQRRDALRELLVIRDWLAGQPDHSIEIAQSRTGSRATLLHDDLGGERFGRDSDPPSLDGLGEIGLLDGSRDDDGLEGLRPALDGEARGLPRARPDHLLEGRETVDRLAVDGDDAVAVPEACVGGRRVGLHASDHREHLDVRQHVEEEQDGHREDEVCRWSGYRDGGLAMRRLLQEAPALVFRRQLFERVVPGELHVAAKGQEAQPVLGLSPLEAPQAGPESDGEADRLDPEPLAHQEVAELMDEDDDTDEDGESYDGRCEGLQKAHLTSLMCSGGFSSTSSLPWLEDTCTQPHKRCVEEERVDPVEEAPVAREDLGAVLLVEGPLQHRFAQVAQGSQDAAPCPDGRRRRPRDGGQEEGAHDQRSRDGGDEPSDRSFPRLAGRNAGIELAAAQGPAREVRASVVGPRSRQAKRDPTQTLIRRTELGEGGEREAGIGRAEDGQPDAQGSSGQLTLEE